MKRAHGNRPVLPARRITLRRRHPGRPVASAPTRPNVEIAIGVKVDEGRFTRHRADGDGGGGLEQALGGKRGGEGQRRDGQGRETGEWRTRGQRDVRWVRGVSGRTRRGRQRRASCGMLVNVTNPAVRVISYIVHAALLVVALGGVVLMVSPLFLWSADPSPPRSNSGRRTTISVGCAYRDAHPGVRRRSGRLRLPGAPARVALYPCSPHRGATLRSPADLV